MCIFNKYLIDSIYAFKISADYKILISNIKNFILFNKLHNTVIYFHHFVNSVDLYKFQ